MRSRISLGGITGVLDFYKPPDKFDYDKFFWRVEIGRVLPSATAAAVESNHRVSGSIDQTLIDPGLSTHLFGFA